MKTKTGRPRRSKPAESLTLTVVRMYGAAGHYGAPREAVWDAPFAIRNVGGPTRSTFLQLGAPVTWMFEAARTGRAYGQLMLEALFGTKGRDGSLERRLAKALATPDLFEAPDKHNWYVTIWTERQLPLEPHDGAPGRRMLGLADPFATDEAEVAEASPVLDQVAGALSLVIEVGRLVPILANRLVVSGAVSAPYVAPRVQMGKVSTIVGHPPLADAEAVQVLGALPARSKAVQRSLTWHVAATEEEDPLKRFLYSFLALEVLVQADAGPDRRSKALANIRARSQVGLATSLFPASNDDRLSSRFSLLAYALRPDHAEADCNLFNDLVKERNNWMHGRETDPDRLRSGDAMQLFRTYARALLV